MIHSAVKTSKKAIKLIENWGFENSNHSFEIIRISGQCECGETQGYKAEYQTADGDKTVRVLFCDGCGDDNDIYDNVLIIED